LIDYLVPQFLSSSVFDVHKINAYIWCVDMLRTEEEIMIIL